MSKVTIMRLLTSTVWVVSGAIGIAACNPDTAGAKDYQAQATQVQAVASKKIEPVQIASADQKTIHVIEIHKMKFQTKSLNVKVGDTVTWINKDLVPHTATANDKSWDSGRLSKGESFSLTITSQTNLDYFCFYHRQMKAKLVLAISQ